jgi:hypothetical protein
MDIVDRLRAMGGFLNELDREQDKVELADIAGLIQSNRELIRAQFKEITRLTAEVAELRKDKWISVDDRLPTIEGAEVETQSDDVLIAYKDYLGTYRVSTSTLVYFKNFEPVWKGFHPTHWQPIPTPPAIDAAIKSEQKES